MKRTLAFFAVVVLATCTTTLPLAVGDTYTDVTGDLNDGTVGEDFSGLTHLDITSVEVNNTFGDLVFKINLAGDPIAVDWGKYCIGFTTNNSTGDTRTNGNGWGRCISLTQGMDFWVGTWVDSGNGGQLWGWDGAGWNMLEGSLPISVDTNSVSVRVPFGQLGKAFSDDLEFEVYSTGGTTADPAIDALTDPSVTVTEWSGCYASDLVSTYTLVTNLAVFNQVSLMCDMGVPIWEFDTATANGFDTNSDTLFVRGSFTGWTNEAGYELIQVGPTLFSNTVEVLAGDGDLVFYKFYGDPFPMWEEPLLLGGGNRSLVIETGSVIYVPEVCFGDRCLTDPPTNKVTFAVDMSFQQEWGEFDPATDVVTLPGDFNGWDTNTIMPTLTRGAPPDTNIYSGSLEYYYYPTGSMTIGYFKGKINGALDPRDGGWERPISTSGGNRSFSLESVDQVLEFKFNDEDGIFPIDRVERLDPYSATLTFGAYAEAIYNIQSRSTTDGAWSTIGSVTNTTKDYGDVSFTHTGLTGVDEQYYRAEFKGFSKPALP